MRIRAREIENTRLSAWKWFRQAQPIAFGLGGLVPGWILDFGGCVRVRGVGQRMGNG